LGISQHHFQGSEGGITCWQKTSSVLHTEMRQEKSSNVNHKNWTYENNMKVLSGSRMVWVAFA
jgi:hypothetical protein